MRAQLSTFLLLLLIGSPIVMAAEPVQEDHDIEPKINLTSLEVVVKPDLFTGIHCKKIIFHEQVKLVRALSKAEKMSEDFHKTYRNLLKHNLEACLKVRRQLVFETSWEIAEPSIMQKISGQLFGSPIDKFITIGIAFLERMEHVEEKARELKTFVAQNITSLATDLDVHCKGGNLCGGTDDQDIGDQASSSVREACQQTKWFFAGGQKAKSLAAMELQLGTIRNDFNATLRHVLDAQDKETTTAKWVADVVISWIEMLERLTQLAKIGVVLGSTNL